MQWTSATPASASYASDDGYHLEASIDTTGKVSIEIATDSGPVEIGDGFSEALSFDVQAVLDQLAVAEHVQRLSKAEPR